LREFEIEDIEKLVKKLKVLIESIYQDHIINGLKYYIIIAENFGKTKTIIEELKGILEMNRIKKILKGKGSNEL